MKNIKYLSLLLVMLVGLVFLTGCGNKNVEGTLPEIMEKLYEGISEEEMPMMIENIELNDENFVNYAFIEDVNYSDALASESMITSTAHSVVLIRLEDAKDSEIVVEELKEKANPRKWICVEAENTYVLSKGDLVVLIMSNELAPKIKENFENLE